MTSFNNTGQSHQLAAASKTTDGSPRQNCQATPGQPNTIRAKKYKSTGKTRIML
jgi:hypothetical protein